LLEAREGDVKETERDLPNDEPRKKEQKGPQNLRKLNKGNKMKGKEQR